jgi:hypothetical protein
MNMPMPNKTPAHFDSNDLLFYLGLLLLGTGLGFGVSWQTALIVVGSVLIVVGVVNSFVLVWLSRR